MRTYLCLAALLMMAGCASKPKPAISEPAKTLFNDKWAIAHLTVDPKVETVQVTKYRYTCPEGYALAVYGHSFSAWRDTESTQMAVSQVTMPTDGLLEKENDALTCLYIEPPKKP